MKFLLTDISKSHPVVLAARLMHVLHSEHEGMYEPCRLVLVRFPMLTPEQVMCLWIAVNMSECSLEDYESINLVGVHDVQ